MSQFPPSQQFGNISYMQPVPPKTNGPAIASLVLGLFGCLPFITGLLAVVFGVVGITKAKDPTVGGKGMAIAGLILGCISLVAWTLLGGGAWALVVGTKAPRAMNRQFIISVAVGGAATSRAQATSTLSDDELDQLKVKMAPLGGVTDVTCLSTDVNSNNGVTVADLKGTISFAGGSKSFTSHLVKQSNGWMVDQFHLQ